MKNVTTKKAQGATKAHLEQEKTYGKPEDSADVRVVGWEGYQKLREKELAGKRFVDEPRVEKGYGKKLDSVSADQKNSTRKESDK